MDARLTCRLRIVIAALALGSVALGSHAAVVQIDMSSVFDSDVIVNNGLGPIDVSQLPVDDGLAGGNYCLITQSAAVFRNPADPDGLPDDGSFPATAFHPDVQLAYRNDDDGVNGKRLLFSGDSVTFQAPPGRYGELHLFALSGSGSVDMTATLTYDDLTSDVMPPATVPDWFDDPIDTLDLYHLVDGMDRVQADGLGNYEDFDDPAVLGVRYKPDATKVLVSVTITRASGTLAVLNLLGATGVTAGGAQPTVYESLDAASVAIPANAVGTAVTSPFPWAPAGAPLLFYQVDDGTGAPPLIQLVKGGPGILLHW